MVSIHTLTSNNDCEAPSYCSSIELGFGGSDWMNVLDGSDSDICNLETYASTINEINVISTDNTNNLWSSFMNVSAIVGELDGQEIYLIQLIPQQIHWQNYGDTIYSNMHIIMYVIEF